ncbi:MAG: cysteine desulfurase [Lachnospiraceae bacterium]|nr:cysteine desulfurase [Lachnospiraceae bacterium]
MREIYLDNAATTRTDREVVELMNKVMLEDYGNPSSKHLLGLHAEKYIKEAKERICKVLKCEGSEIVFTSGGTESNNTALIGAAYANKRKGMHIISTRIEHASVYNPLFFLEDNGFEVTYIGTDKYGHVDVDALIKAVRSDTILIAVMHVNNEIGSINDIERIGKEAKSINPEVLFFVDAIQSFGKVKIVPKNAMIDMMSVSGHKIYGPKGSGFLYIKNKTKIKPIIYGGEQQKGMRSGTENVPAIAGLGLAVKKMFDSFDENVNSMYEVKKHFIKRLEEVEGASVNGIPENSVLETAPHVLSVSFDKVRSEVLLHALEEKGIYVSSGSACSSNHPAISGTLKAIGVKKELLDSTLRFSFSIYTTKEEIDCVIDELKALLPVLRRFTRR